MKKIFTIMAMLMLTVGIFAQDLAVSMKTDKLAGNNITLKLVAGGSGTFSIDWGNGILLPYTISASAGSPTTITQATPVDNAEIKLYVDAKYITYLDCNTNELTELDITPSSTFTTLNCYNNKLTALDITTNPNLAVLQCYNNQITTLDFTNSSKLWRIYCWSNKITTFTNFENLVALKDFSSRINPLSHGYNISGISTLETFAIQNNNITSLDVTGCTALTTLTIHNEGPTYANNFDACALDALYSTLPDRTGKTTGNLRVLYYSTANPVWDNIAEVNGSDKTIATAKNWNVTIRNNSTSIFTGDGGACISTNNLAPESTPFNLYPNPTKGLVQINITGEIAGRQLRVLDITGRLMKERAVTAAKMTLDTSDFPKGIYFVSTGKNVQKLVVE